MPEAGELSTKEDVAGASYPTELTTLSRHANANCKKVAYLGEASHLVGVREAVKHSRDAHAKHIVSVETIVSRSVSTCGSLLGLGCERTGSVRAQLRRDTVG